MMSESSLRASHRSATVAVPPGFAPYQTVSPYIAHLGPMYQREDEQGMVVFGLRIASHHLNLHGKAHGGMLSVLIDNALGYNIARARQQGVVTAHLSIDFLEAVELEDWLESHVRLTKSGGRLCFAECVLRVGGRDMGRASGILPIVKSPA